eukprot:scaffold219355_cov25-Prasinocladus_malaysianus.AAC.1
MTRGRMFSSTRYSFGCPPACQAQQGQRPGMARRCTARLSASVPAARLASATSSFRGASSALAASKICPVFARSLSNRCSDRQLLPSQTSIFFRLYIMTLRNEWRNWTIPPLFDWANVGLSNGLSLAIKQSRPPLPYPFCPC